VDVLYCSMRSIVLRTIDVLENNRIRHARQASHQAQGRLQGTQALVKEEDLEVISLGSDDGSEGNGRNDTQAEDSGEDTEKTELKRKRDPDTPRKPKRPPPSLRDVSI
jgi:hypothetical protein